MRPLATITSRMWRGVAPRAATNPSWRWRRWATTTKPAAAISATRAMASVTTISTKARTACFSLPMTSTRNADVSAAGSSAAAARAAAAAVWPSVARSRVKRSAGAAGSGTTRAKSSARSPGFSTRPTTVRVRPPRSTCRPMPVDSSSAAPSVRATSPLVLG